MLFLCPLWRFRDAILMHPEATGRHPDAKLHIILTAS